MRQISDKELIHEKLGDRFETELSLYDTNRRIAVLVDDFLAGHNLSGKRVLEVGAGLGHFTERLHQLGGSVLATDIGDSLLDRIRKRVGCECQRADALQLVDTFGGDSFDLVFSSECIEHTPDPKAALRQMARVLKPGGYLIVSTPNLLWSPLVHLANALKVRAFDGLENFSTFRGIRDVLKSEDVTVLREEGLHLFPFQLPLHGLSTWCDNHLQALRGCMINICVMGRKHAATQS